MPHACGGRARRHGSERAVGRANIRRPRTVSNGQTGAPVGGRLPLGCRETLVGDALLLWRYEHIMWTDPVGFCREHLSPDALLAMSGTPLAGAAGVARLSRAARCGSPRFSAQRVLHVSREAAVIAYVAEASGEDTKSSYVARCISTYARVRGSWLLVAHQRDDAAPCATRQEQLEALSRFLEAADCDAAADASTSASSQG